jgi:hypothetical protein
MRAFDEAVLHQALDGQVAPAPVPPLPFEAIVRAGTRRRRARRVLVGACTTVVLAAASVLGATAGSTPSQVVTPQPAQSPPHSPPGTVGSGMLHGVRWSAQIVNYRGYGGQPCTDWIIDVGGHTSHRECDSPATDAEFESREVLRDPANRLSQQLGVVFLGMGAPHGAVTLRAAWGGGSARSEVFHLKGDRRGYFLLAVPYVPGHPKSYYLTTLDFLDTSGHVLPGGFDNPPVPWHIDYAPAKD